MYRMLFLTMCFLSLNVSQGEMMRKTIAFVDGQDWVQYYVAPHLSDRETEIAKSFNKFLEDLDIGVRHVDRIEHASVIFASDNTFYRTVPVHVVVVSERDNVESITDKVQTQVLKIRSIEEGIRLFGARTRPVPLELPPFPCGEALWKRESWRVLIGHQLGLENLSIKQLEKKFCKKNKKKGEVASR